MSPDTVADMTMKGECEIHDASNIQGHGADKDGWSDNEREAGAESVLERIGGKYGG